MIKLDSCLFYSK